MAHVLQDDNKVTELYLCNDDRGGIKGSKYLLYIKENGSIELKWCYEDITETQINPMLVKVSRGMRVEYGEPNLFMQRQMLPFQDENGNLNEIWEKII